MSLIKVLLNLNYSEYMIHHSLCVSVLSVFEERLPLYSTRHGMEFLNMTVKTLTWRRLPSP